MGGIGSGRRWHFSAKSTTGSLWALDIRRIVRAGCLRPGYSFGWQWPSDCEPDATIQIEVQSPDAVRLSYRVKFQSGNWQNHDYQVRLDRTPCHLGGERVWFLCPAQGCGRRVAKLYGRAIFACRHCHDLAYTSQRESRFDRAARRHEKLRARLGWPGSIFDASYMWQKPKGMHWRTFSRLALEAQATQDKALALIGEQFGFDITS